ncbi:MAG TPA: competence type IV pilus ATPase ComGA [Alloiococcus sp.]|nr:competence type IV pilus ATPase ComGA [Alloiococcus sp.]
MEVESFAQHIIELAMTYQTSDVHILPESWQYIIYFRLGGQMVRQFILEQEEGVRLISYLKFLANMDVGERRKPQSGSCTFELNSPVDLRLSTISNYRTNESLVIRLLSKKSEDDHIEQCFFKYELTQLKQLVKYKSGLILFSGPVDSGKTTTMYNLIRNRSFTDKQQVISIEDPVEIEEADFLQVQVNEAAGITYESLIKSSLRHHPDVLIVGEIRDEETAKMVARGALTGHLIIASVHAKDAYGVIARLKELGISEELLQQIVIGIVFQKLLPIYCALCGGSCQTSCNHISPAAKRMVLYDVRYNDLLRELFNKNMIKEGDRCNRSFNQLLKKVCAYGYISKETYQSYKIP